MYFIIFKSTVNNQWYFNINSDNHEKIAASEGYTTKQSAQHTVGVIKAGAARARTYDKSTEQWLD